MKYSQDPRQPKLQKFHAGVPDPLCCHKSLHWAHQNLMNGDWKVKNLFWIREKINIWIYIKDKVQIIHKRKKNTSLTLEWVWGHRSPTGGGGEGRPLGRHVLNALCSDCIGTGMVLNGRPFYWKKHINLSTQKNMCSQHKMRRAARV